MAEEYPDADDGDAYSNVTLAANLDKFIDGEGVKGTLTSQYYFDNTDENGERVLTAETLFDNIQDLMSEDMIKQIKIADKENWNKGDDDVYDADEFKPVADYNALPGLINGYLGTQTEGGIAGMPAKVLKAAYLDNGTTEGAITLTIKADLLALVEESLGGEEEGESDPMADLVTQLLPKAIYLNVNYSLNGTSEVTITINDVDEEYGDGQSAADFETIFNLLALFGVNLEMETESGVIVIDNYDEICEMVGDTIASAFDELGVRLGGNLEFTKDNVLFPNIFQVISANEIFSYSYDPQLAEEMTKEEFEETYAIDDAELYTILDAMYGYETTGSDLGENIANVKSELDKKYYVNLTSENAEGLFDEIKTLKTNLGKLRVSSDGVQDGKTYMVQDTTPIDDLKPLFNATDIAALIKGSRKLDMASISLLTDTVITSSTIENVAGKDRIVFEVTGEVNAEAEGASNAKMYEPLFPDYMSVIVTITEEVTNTGADEAKELATTYNLNGIEDDLMKKTMFFIARLSGNRDMTKENVEEDISEDINDAFGSLTSGGAVTLDIDGTNKNVRLGNVFEVATAAIWEKEDGTISEDRPSDVLFRSTIKELWAGLDGYGQANGENIKALGYTEKIAPFSVNGLSADTRISDAFIGSQMATDANMGNITDALGITNKDAVSVYQTYIIPGSGTPATSELATGYVEKDRYDEIIEYFEGTDLISGSGDMLFTLRLGKKALNGVMNSEGESMSISDDMQHFVPDDMFVSAGITISEEGLNNVRIVINRLEAEEQRVLQDMLARFGVDIAGLFGGEDTTLANKIAETPIVTLTKDEVEGLPAPISVTVRDLFNYAGGTDGGTRFVSGITADLGGQDNSYESSYIYWDYIGDYRGCDDSTKFESGNVPEVYNVGLGYLYYRIDLSGYVPGN